LQTASVRFVSSVLLTSFAFQNTTTHMTQSVTCFLIVSVAVSKLGCDALFTVKFWARFSKLPKLNLGLRFS